MPAFFLRVRRDSDQNAGSRRVPQRLRVRVIDMQMRRGISVVEDRLLVDDDALHRARLREGVKLPRHGVLA